MDHFRQVLYHGWDLRNKWNNIGVELGIDPATLDVIKQSHPENPDDCFKEVIQRWLRKAKPDPTLDQLNKALTAKTVAGMDLITTKNISDYGGDTTTCAGERDVTTVDTKKQKSPIHLLQGSNLKLVNIRGTKHVEWRQHGKDRNEEYTECNYTNDSNMGIPVFIQKGYEIPQLLKVDSKLQYGWQGDFHFFVLHDQKRKPYQHRFVSTTTKEFFKQSSSLIAGIWGAHLVTVKDI